MDVAQEAAVTKSYEEAYRSNLMSAVYDAVVAAGTQSKRGGIHINIPLAVDAMAHAMSTFIVSTVMIVEGGDRENTALNIDAMAIRVASCLELAAEKARDGSLPGLRRPRPALRIVN